LLLLHGHLLQVWLYFTRNQQRKSKINMTQNNINTIPKPGPEHKHLDVFVGKWNTGGMLLK
jgi:hypothetical protein